MIKAKNTAKYIVVTLLVIPVVIWYMIRGIREAFKDIGHMYSVDYAEIERAKKIKEMQDFKKRMRCNLENCGNTTTALKGLMPGQFGEKDKSND